VPATGRGRAKLLPRTAERQNFRRPYPDAERNPAEAFGPSEPRWPRVPQQPRRRFEDLLRLTNISGREVGPSLG